MINKKELRIGNYFKYGEKTFTVLGINNNVVLANSNRGKINFSIQSIEAIPLTEEWLIKFGFEFINDRKQYGWYLEVSKNRNLTWCHSEYVSLEFGKEDYDYNNTLFDFNCKHVHQLQNLYFALTNKEL